MLTMFTGPVLNLYGPGHILALTYFETYFKLLKFLINGSEPISGFMVVLPKSREPAFFDNTQLDTEEGILGSGSTVTVTSVCL
jgi:hypothetical protein